MGILAIQFPNEEIKVFKGEWEPSGMESLTENQFFITDFTKGEVFSFAPEHALEKFSEKDLFFNADDSVFSVNGRFYLHGLDVFIEGFEEEGIEKAIYSRIKLEERVSKDIVSQFYQVAKAYAKEALVYLVSDEQFGTWMGATPEILLAGNRKKLRSMALAGTKSEEKQAWTKKEEEEHQYVVDYIHTQIKKQAPSEVVISETETVKNGAVYHLRTNFEFQLSSDKWNALMNSMHPTPAVCGTPMEAAQKYILEMEPHDRRFYTGIIGWRGADELKVYVNLRCMQVLVSKYALYVGGGITKDSELGAEWRETEAKSQTLLSIIKTEE